MAIKRIHISNFRSFSDLEVSLANFNVLIGANASGKSNFIGVFKFLRDISLHGLNNAISMQGGAEYLTNTSIGRSEHLALKVVTDTADFAPPFSFLESTGKRPMSPKPHEVIYQFAIEFRKKGTGFKIVEDKITYSVNYVEHGNGVKRVGEKKLGSGELILSKANKKIEFIDSAAPGTAAKEYGAKVPKYFLEMIESTVARGSLLLESPFLSRMLWTEVSYEKVFDRISVYDFDPRLPKKAVPITGRTELEEDGSNLAIVLKNIVESKEKKRKFSNLIKSLLPFVDDLGVEKFADKSLLFKLREIYDSRQYLPASLISDGTINTAALIVVLFFERKPFIIFEEPERNLHPSLISRTVSMLKEASQKKQIIVTTHNPEIVKHVDLQNLLLISRDESGFSQISKPGEKESVQTFLQNDIGIDELFTRTFLGA